MDSIQIESAPLIPIDSSNEESNQSNAVESPLNSPPNLSNHGISSNEGMEEDSFGDSSSLSHIPKKKGSISRPWLTANYHSNSSPQMISQDHHSKAALMLSSTSPTSPHPSLSMPSWCFSSDKKNAEFHELFPEVSLSQRLIEGGADIFIKF